MGRFIHAPSHYRLRGARAQFQFKPGRTLDVQSILINLTAPMSGSNTAASTEGKHDPYGVLRNRDLRYYFIARLVGIIGQQMFFTALGWEIYDRTRSALALGLVGLTLVVPMILSTLPAGHFADIYNRKRIIVVMTLIMASTNIALTIISAARAPVFLIYLCLLVMGTARTFLAAASASFLPQL